MIQNHTLTLSAYISHDFTIIRKVALKRAHWPTSDSAIISHAVAAYSFTQTNYYYRAIKPLKLIQDAIRIWCLFCFRIDTNFREVFIKIRMIFPFENIINVIVTFSFKLKLKFSSANLQAQKIFWWIFKIYLADLFLRIKLGVKKKFDDNKRVKIHNENLHYGEQLTFNNLWL